MPKDIETVKRDAQIAQFRFALIAPVVQGLYPDASATAYYKRVTEKPLTLPDGSSVTYSYKTLEKWKSQYSIGGLEALMPSKRSDKGSSRALNDEAIEEIYRLKNNFHRMNATQPIIFRKFKKVSSTPQLPYPVDLKLMLRTFSLLF